MSYQVLARKWRPKTFQDMVGQEHILRILENALLQKRIHHAYLFTGTRGVGKTTLARILAACLNCETGITATPCGKCTICKAIANSQFLDFYEVDAASRTKVEDTRELLENVLYQPVKGRYKIYLIDEVHMLSNHSFNALLKTLEEPPEYVKFLLATTDPKRLPITILSRCLQFHLKRITPNEITKHLQHICLQEKIPNETSALEKIAIAASGSMRDALSLLDQAIAFGKGNINQSDVNLMLGSVAQDDILPLLKALIEQDGKQLFSAIRHLADHSTHFEQALTELINVLHQIALSQILPDASITTDESIISLAKRVSAEDVQLYYQIALLGRRDLALTPTPQQGFEMTLLRMLAFKPASTTESFLTPTSNTTTAEPENQTNIAHQATPNTINLPEWRSILPKLELSGMAYALASNCALIKLNDTKIELALALNHQPMLTTKLKERIAEALGRYFNKPLQLEINITNDDLFTPTKHEQKEHEVRIQKATEIIMQEPKVKQLIELYDATVEISLSS